MLKVRKRHNSGQFSETVAEYDNPYEAFEKAHEVDAQLKEDNEPYSVEIVTITTDGRTIDMWNYCARCRCPSGAKNEYLNNLEK
jgi:hypothetical protein